MYNLKISFYKFHIKIYFILFYLNLKNFIIFILNLILFKLILFYF